MLALTKWFAQQKTHLLQNGRVHWVKVLTLMTPLVSKMPFEMEHGSRHFKFHSGHVHRDVNGRIGSQCSMDIVGLGMPPSPTDFCWPWELEIFRGKSFFRWYLAGSPPQPENDSYRPIHITDWSCFGIKHSFRLDCLVSTKYFVSLVSLNTNFLFCIKRRSSGSSFEFDQP